MSPRLVSISQGLSELAPALAEVLAPSEAPAARPGCVRILRRWRSGADFAVALERGFAREAGLDAVHRASAQTWRAGARVRGFRFELGSSQIEAATLEELAFALVRAVHGQGVDAWELASVPGNLRLEAQVAADVSPERELMPSRLQAGDLLIGIAGGGLHAGFERALASWTGPASAASDARLEVTDRSVEQELFAPGRSLGGFLADPLAHDWLHACWPLETQGLARSVLGGLPPMLAVELDLDAWPRPPWWRQILAAEPSADEAARHFALGLGALLVAPPAHAGEVIAELDAWHEPAWIVGRVVAGARELRLAGALD